MHLSVFVSSVPFPSSNNSCFPVKINAQKQPVRFPYLNCLWLPSTGESLNCASAKNAAAEDSTHTSPEQGTLVGVQISVQHNF